MNIFKEAWQYNKDQYKAKVVEEFTEASLAFQHYQQGKVDRYELIDELADAQFQIDKTLYMLQEIEMHNDTKDYFNNRLKDIKERLSKIINHSFKVRSDTLNMFE